MQSIQSIGVVGAGQMGRGIAQLAASTGYRVKLVDANAEQARNGRDHVARDLARLAVARKMTGGDADQILGRIEAVAGLGALAGCDYVVEAVSEDLAVKSKILAELDEILRPETIVGSNTSSISVTKLAAASGRADRVIGLHFLNPVPVMKLVEIVRALQTSDETYETTCELARRLGKTIITTKDMPAFIVNRLLIPQLNEACFALTEGLGTVEEIDQAVRLGLNHPMGPFQLADLLGLDIVLGISEVLQREFGDDKYRPPTILRSYVAAGWLGRKTGRGFYHYNEG
ncbi:MAG: 3-hydroxyacyl-CoA dehydrogenase family protein, partial [Candidatus Binatia bacterium]